MLYTVSGVVCYILYLGRYAIYCVWDIYIVFGVVYYIMCLGGILYNVSGVVYYTV